MTPDVPDERLVAGLRRILGQLDGPAKFGWPEDVGINEVLLYGKAERYKRCFVCDQPYSCHGGWACPDASHIDMNCSGKKYWLEREQEGRKA